MIITPLASGSKGNSYLIESLSTKILIDAGLSAKQLALRLEDADCKPSKISAICVTHEHGDHIGGVRVFAKRFNVPVYINSACYDVAQEKYKLDEINDIRFFEAGDKINHQDLMLHAMRITHDTIDPVCFSIDDGKHSSAVVTHLGKMNTLVLTQLKKVDALILEANHDLLMLKMNINYPEKIKQRIRSNRGHLSNDQSAEAAIEIIEKGKLKHLTLAHLSENNNSEKHVLKTYRKYMDSKGIDLPFNFAKQHIISEKIIL